MYRLYYYLIIAFVIAYTLTSCITKKKWTRIGFEKGWIDTSDKNKYTTIWKIKRDTNYIDTVVNNIVDTIYKPYKVAKVIHIDTCIKLAKTASKRATKNAINRPCLEDTLTMTKQGATFKIWEYNNKIYFDAICPKQSINVCPEKNWYERNQMIIDLLLLGLIVVLLFNAKLR